jgi:hypothetical protein
MRAFFAGRLTTAGALLAVVTLSLATGPPAQAHNGLRAQGTIHELGPPGEGHGGVVVVRTRLGNVPFWLTAETRVELEHQPATLADLRAGDAVKVNYAVTTERWWATRIDASRPHVELFGLVTAATKVENVVRVTIDPPVGDPKTLQVDGRTDVELGEQEASDLTTWDQAQLDTLKGSYARAEFLAETDVARKLRLNRARRLPFRGTVQSVDAEHRTLVVTSGEQTLSLVCVDPATIIRLDGQRVGLEKLTPGDRCEGSFVMVLEGETVSNVAIIIHTKTPRPVEYSGTIESVAPAEVVMTAGKRRLGSTEGAPQGTLTLVLRNGTKVEKICVYAGTHLRINGKPATFAELQPGQKCHVLCIPRPDGYHCFRLQAKKLGTSG